MPAEPLTTCLGYRTLSQKKLGLLTYLLTYLLGAGMPAEPLTTCLGYRTLSQKKLYKAMEDHAYIYRSIYVEHLQSWLRFYPPSQLLVLPSESLFAGVNGEV